MSKSRPFFFVPLTVNIVMEASDEFKKLAEKEKINLENYKHGVLKKGKLNFPYNSKRDQVEKTLKHQFFKNLNIPEISFEPNFEKIIDVLPRREITCKVKYEAIENKRILRITTNIISQNFLPDANRPKKFNIYGKLTDAYILVDRKTFNDETIKNEIARIFAVNRKILGVIRCKDDKGYKDHYYCGVAPDKPINEEIYECNKEKKCFFDSLFFKKWRNYSDPTKRTEFADEMDKEGFVTQDSSDAFEFCNSDKDVAKLFLYACV